MDLTDCFVFSCNGKEGQGNKATVLAAPGSPDTSVEHKGGGSVDPGSSRVPSETPALLAAGKEKPRIAQMHPLQYSGLENSMDSPWGRKESDTRERLSLHFCYQHP